MIRTAAAVLMRLEEAMAAVEDSLRESKTVDDSLREAMAAVLEVDTTTCGEERWKPLVEKIFSTEGKMLPQTIRKKLEEELVKASDGWKKSQRMEEERVNGTLVPILG